jgi:hypothetical protein
MAERFITTLKAALGSRPTGYLLHTGVVFQWLAKL